MPCEEFLERIIGNMMVAMKITHTTIRVLSPDGLSIPSLSTTGIMMYITCIRVYIETFIHSITSAW